MPIRLNLLAEQQEAEEARRRDPVKRTLWIAGSLVGLFLLWGIYLFVIGLMASSRLRKQELTLAGLQTDFTQATNTLNRLNTFEDRIFALNKYASNRFLWGNSLNALQYAAVEDVQVLTIGAQQDLKK